MDDRSQPRTERRRLTHVDRRGRPRMVDVSGKPPTARRAVAEAEVACSQETLTLVIDGGGPKGDVLTVAELAGVMAAKRTSELIPLCHPLLLTHVGIEFVYNEEIPAVEITATVRCRGRTGVEMEALTAAGVAALTIYDMAKAVERGMVIDGIRLLEKRGGKSGEWKRE
jgi:cyclic pyranopterin phosphate synthase